MGVAVGTGVAAGVGRPCWLGSSPYLFVHPAQNRQVRRDKRRNALMGCIFCEGVTVNNPPPFVKWKSEMEKPRRA
jgi:hypothetical protein